VNNAGNRTLTGFLASPLEFGFNNNNSAGVSGGTAAANQAAAAAVTTGLEFSIALADLGNPVFGSLIKLHVAYGNQDNNFHSNQVLAGLPTDLMNGVAMGTGNLGGNGSGGFTGTLSGVNFSSFAGDQFFSIRVPVPEPASGALAGLAGLAMAAGARRRSA
jgi:MYXO-CTERM domain-containing protein